MDLDLERVRERAREATTEDLLDRVTVYRGGMDPAALEVLEEELRRRDITETQVREHGEREGQGILWERPGLAVQCHLCRKPAIRIEVRWRRLLGLIPLYRRGVACCRMHATQQHRLRLSDSKSR